MIQFGSFFGLHAMVKEEDRGCVNVLSSGRCTRVPAHTAEATLRFGRREFTVMVRLCDICRHGGDPDPFWWFEGSVDKELLGRLHELEYL